MMITYRYFDIRGWDKDQHEMAIQGFIENIKAKYSTVKDPLSGLKCLNNCCF